MNKRPHNAVGAGVVSGAGIAHGREQGSNPIRRSDRRQTGGRSSQSPPVWMHRPGRPEQPWSGREPCNRMWKYHSYLASQRRQWRRRAQAQEGQTSQFVIRRQPAVPRCPRGEAEPGRQGAAILALLVSLCYTDRPATLPVGSRPLGGLSHTQAEAC